MFLTVLKLRFRNELYIHFTIAYSLTDNKDLLKHFKYIFSTNSNSCK